MCETEKPEEPQEPDADREAERVAFIAGASAAYQEYLAAFEGVFPPGLR